MTKEKALNNRNHSQNDSYEEKRAAIFRRQRARRIRERAMRRSAGLIVILLLFSITFGFFTLHGRANGKDNQKLKYYAGITIQEGDTLWSIADTYMDKDFNTRTSFIEEVKSINHISDDNRIQAGKLLIVPYYSTEYVID